MIFRMSPTRVWLLVIVTGLVLLATSSIGAAAPSEQAILQPIHGGTLYGTLTLPKGKGPFPVALIVAGSGPTDRDGNSPMLRSDTYKLLAASLAQSGIASVRYDKRGIGQSSMPGLSEADLRFGMFVDDAVAWAERLRGDARFSRVSVVGHSEGVLIATLAAQRSTSVAFVVSLEGAGYEAGDVLASQLRANPANAPILNESLAAIAALKSGNNVASVSPILWPLFRPSVQPYLISWFAVDPALEIAKLRVPILIVQGTTDLQVSVADAKRLASGAPSATLVLVPGMNHVLRDAPADRPANFATYSQPSLPLDAKATSAIAEFLLAP